MTKLPGRCFACQQAAGPSKVMPNSTILTVRFPVLSSFERHDSLPTSVQTHRRVPPRRGRHGTSNTGTTWCSLRKVIPEVCVLFLSPGWWW